MSAKVDHSTLSIQNPCSSHYLNRPSTATTFDAFSPVTQKLIRSRSYNPKSASLHVRPHTAAATNYLTSYQRDFCPKQCQDENLVDVPQGQQYPIGCPYQLDGPIGIGHYQEQFTNKGYCRSQPIRTATASGTRANNPHPSQEFMVWKYPGANKANPYNQDEFNHEQQEQIKQALKNQLTSTYRSDYLGIPQGFQMNLAFSKSRPFWRTRACYSYDSEQRDQYRAEHQLRNLSNNTSRYGCNPQHRIAADAIAPQTNPLWKQIQTKTSYDQEYNEKAPSDLYMRDFVDHLTGPLDRERENIEQSYDRGEGMNNINTIMQAVEVAEQYPSEPIVHVQIEPAIPLKEETVKHRPPSAYRFRVEKKVLNDRPSSQEQQLEKEYHQHHAALIKSKNGELTQQPLQADRPQLTPGLLSLKRVRSLQNVRPRSRYCDPNKSHILSYLQQNPTDTPSAEGFFTRFMTNVRPSDKHANITLQKTSPNLKDRDYMKHSMNMIKV
ncbi:unnamed protein product [Didymodactylos carnosus]|uniref:Uncharacterized protein n=1 Tax=Didymodactylos carnosus TaxID=1234261 RepID=A0A814X7F4_9BILA|nr:unnamed protein product [Didymodactylos carnosus]CAF1212411.1 unnamed protein product [Didymodactylos carnosus]CAF3787871.1 unnamed protein product [Didymodactylos carnosus]CAF3976384.1 unnamed protein product [Didymodactylos carnosus]